MIYVVYQFLQESDSKGFRDILNSRHDEFFLENTYIAIYKTDITMIFGPLQWPNTREDRHPGSKTSQLQARQRSAFPSEQ